MADGDVAVVTPGVPAQTDRLTFEDDRVVNYVFPVEVLVVGGLSDADRDAIETQIWESFTDAMTRQT